MLLSPFFVYFFSSPELFKQFTIWEVMGLRTAGLLSAFVIPFLLTMILFLGPLSVQLTNGIWKIYSGSIDENCHAQNEFFFHNSFSFAIFRANVLAELLSKSFMASKSCRCSSIRGIHISCLYVATSSAILFSNDCNLHHAAIFRSW